MSQKKNDLKSLWDNQVSKEINVCLLSTIWKRVNLDEGTLDLGHNNNIDIK